MRRVRGKAFPKWMVIQSSPSSKAVFLRELLRKKFPAHSFLHLKAPQEVRKIVTGSIDGIILELKNLNEATLAIYDKFNKYFQAVPKILVLTPSGYQTLSSKRKDVLDHSLIILSEIKSLDYILQLPRFIEEVGRKRRLKLQNERLQRLIRQRIPQLESFGNTPVSINSEEMIRDLFADDSPMKRTHQCGLKLKLKSWSKVQDFLNIPAQNEVVDLLYRLINGIVRNSDRVLRSAEDEFLIFLSNTQSAHLSRCKERLEKALKSFRIEANNRSIRFPVQIASLDHLSYLSS